jgi:hypothetical protein
VSKKDDKHNVQIKAVLIYDQINDLLFKEVHSKGVEGLAACYIALNLAAEVYNETISKNGVTDEMMAAWDTQVEAWANQALDVDREKVHIH